MYKSIFTKKAEKDLEKIANHDRENVLKRLRIIDFPFPANFDIKKYSSIPGFYRLRVGIVRVFIEVSQDRQEIWVHKIKYRGDAY